MELVAGTDLSRYTRPSHLLPERLVARLGARVALALNHAHRQGVVHRDVKPANILVDWPNDIVKLADFGIARWAGEPRTRSGQALGSPDYMAPEQLAGSEVGPAADIYSLGVTLFELLCGRRPHATQSLGALLRAVAHEAPPHLRSLRPDLPELLCQTVMSALAKVPAQRPADAAVVGGRAGAVESRAARDARVRSPTPGGCRRAGDTRFRGTIGATSQRQRAGAPRSAMTFEYFHAVDPGRARSNNEDSVEIDPANALAVLADGMGGYNAGEVASNMATSFIKTELGRWLQEATDHATDTEVRRAMDICVDNANRAIFNAANSNPQYAGMGTTLVVAVFRDNRLLLGHVGDSRAYRWRGGRLNQITRDHSLLQEQIDAGLITAEQAAFSANKNLVTRAVGVEDTVLLETHLARGVAGRHLPVVLGWPVRHGRRRRHRAAVAGARLDRVRGAGAGRSCQRGGRKG